MTSYIHEEYIKKYPEVFGDEYTLKILADTFLVPKNVQEISIKHDIPIAACYRRVQLLERIGLLRCVDRKLTIKGKRVKVYQSNVRNVSLRFENGKIRIQLELTTRPEINSSWDVLKPEIEINHTTE